MTAELVLLMAVYAALILGLFFDENHGVIYTFRDNLPKLSIRIEKHLATGVGFQASPNGWNWEAP